MLHNTSLVAKSNGLPEEAFAKFASNNAKRFQLSRSKSVLPSIFDWRVSTSFSEALITAFKEAKGIHGGNCNRTCCQMPGAIYFNHGTRLWYCYKCAIWLNTDPYNARDAQELFGHDLCTLEENPNDLEKNPNEKGLTTAETEV